MLRCRENKRGFTLSEILVTLAVIGIVISITMPVLVNNYKKTQYVTAYKKALTVLQQAYNRVKSDNDVFDLTQITGSGNDHLSLLCSHLNCIKICDEGQDPGVCFHHGTSGWKTLHGSDGWYNPTANQRALLADGSMFRFYYHSTGDYGSFQRDGVNIGLTLFDYDINGFKPPNISGRDMFQIVVTKYGEVYPRATHAGGTWEGNGVDHGNTCDAGSTNEYNGLSCGARILEDGWVMNY